MHVTGREGKTENLLSEADGTRDGTSLNLCLPQSPKRWAFQYWFGMMTVVLR